MLVDVTSLMQRERSALRLLYELLVIHYPNLPLGRVPAGGLGLRRHLPRVGGRGEQEGGADAGHPPPVLLAPRAGDAEDGARSRGRSFNEERRRALDQLVKTVLLAEVSPRLKQGGLTIERLVQLNSVDVEGETFRGQVRVAETDLLALSQRVPDLQVAGQGKTALVRYVLGRVSLGEVPRPRALEGRQPRAALQGVLGGAEAGARRSRSARASRTAAPTRATGT